MKDRLIYREVEIIKQDLHYYNFIKSIIRLFAVRLRQQVPSIGSYTILDTCGTGGNGIVFEVADARDGRKYALKIPYLSYYMIQLFDLSIEHMYDDPYEKIDEIAEYIDSVSFEVRTSPRAHRTHFGSVGEERSCLREYYCLEAMKDCKSTVFLCDYGIFDLISRRIRHPDQLRQLSYYVTPLFQGIPLTQYPGPNIPQVERWRIAFTILEKVIDIVDEVHRRGVIHRDLHPGNFLYCKETDEVHLIDFGSSLANLGISLDTDGENRGSKRFIPPEQFANPRCADARSDYFCIGGLLLHMLTSRSPFQRDRKQDTRPLFARQTLKKPEQMTEEAFEKTIRFLDRLMSFQRSERYQNTEEIRKDLSGLISAVQMTPVHS